MEKMVNIYLYGKKYEVPESLTIMNAMEYAGYQLVRGVGKCGRCNVGAKYVCKDGPVFRCDELDELPSEY